MFGEDPDKFEVTYLDIRTGKRVSYGKTKTIDGAQAMKESIDIHPSMDKPWINEIKPADADPFDVNPKRKLRSYER